MRRQSFVLSAIILALGGFFAKAIGALYKIPLTNILGSAGIGIYYLIFPLYSLIITISSSGISVAVSNEVAKCRKLRHRYNEHKILRVALVFSFVISIILTIILLFLSNHIAYLQGNINAGLGYIAIAPAIILSTIIATLRGYFQGIENMIPTTISLIVEQVIKLSFGLLLAHKLCNLGLEYAVFGAIIGVTISEIVALIIIVINYILYKGQLDYNYRNKFYKPRENVSSNELIKRKKDIRLSSHTKTIYKCNINRNRYTTKVALKKLMAIAIPSTLSSLILPIITMLDSFMVINLLVSSGYSSYVSTSLYGLWGGIVQSLLSLPIIIIAAISTSLVPSLSGTITQNDSNLTRQRVAFFIKITWVLSIIMFVIFFVFAEDILQFLYGGLSSSVIDELYYATRLMQLSSVSIIFYAFLQTFTAILQTMGKSHIPFVTMLLSSVIRIGLTIIFVSNPYLNIFGLTLANIIFLSIVDIVLAFVIIKKVEISYKFFTMLKPLLVGIILLLLAILINSGLKYICNYILSTCITAVIITIAYAIIIFFSKVFTHKEMEFMRLRKVKLSKK